MTITVQLRRNDEIRSLALERPPSYTEIIGISKQLFGIKDAEVSLRCNDDAPISMKSDINLEEAVNMTSGLLHVIVQDLKRSEELRKSLELRRSMELVRSGGIRKSTGVLPSPFTPPPHSKPPTSSSAPSTPALKSVSRYPLYVPTFPNASPPAASMLTRLYELMKYINIPDVLHGLENFGYVTADQSGDIFGMLEGLTDLFPDLKRVMSYEDHETPLCTVRHKGITCNSCLTSDISGTRYKCAICPDFDMCEKCERKGILTHDITHPRIKMLVPSNCEFEHICSAVNSQGERKEEVSCPFTSLDEPVSPTSSTYHKRQSQFNTLLQKKLQKEEVLRLRREQKQKLQEELEKSKSEKCEIGSKPSQDSPKKKGVLWSYFDSLKKQNKLQSIAPTPPSSSSPSPSSSATPISSSSTSTCQSSTVESSSSSSSSLRLSSSSLSLSLASPSLSLYSLDSLASTTPSSLNVSVGNSSACWVTETEVFPPSPESRTGPSEIRMPLPARAIPSDFRTAPVRPYSAVEISSSSDSDIENYEEKMEKKEGDTLECVVVSEKPVKSPRVLRTISSRLKTEPLFAPTLPDTSPFFPKLNLGILDSPSPPASKLRMSQVISAEEAEEEEDEFSQHSAESDALSDSTESNKAGSDKNDKEKEKDKDSDDDSIFSAFRRKKRTDSTKSDSNKNDSNKNDSNKSDSKKNDSKRERSDSFFGSFSLFS